MKSLILQGRVEPHHIQQKYVKETSQDEYSRIHCKRFALTMNLIGRAAVTMSPGLPALNLGGRHLLDTLVEAEIGMPVVNLESDLRFPWGLNRKWQLILCTEVLEHLSDQPEESIERIAAFTRTGLHTCLNEIAGHLDPETGRAIITTPNCSSYEALRRWLGWESPAAYHGHFREYGYNELMREVRRCGLEPVESGTWNCYYTPAEHVVKMVTPLHGDWTAHRGDTTYMCVKKACS